MSHPTWVRGLKRKFNGLHDHKCDVAPHVGAWIETGCCGVPVRRLQSHPTWVRGLKHYLKTMQPNALSRTPRGCVD